MTGPVEESGPHGGPVVVFVHGSMDRSTGFAKVVRRLDMDHRVVRYDRRGYGRSGPSAGPFTIEQHVLDLLAAMAARRAVLVGHSLGGNLALAAADRAPALVSAVVCFEAPMSWEPWWPSGTAGGQAVDRAREDEASAAEAAEGFMRRMLGDERWDRLPAATKEARRREGVALVGELSDLQRAAPYAVSHVRCPVLLARGERGAEHHRLGTAAMAERFPAASVHVIEGAGHGAHTSHPEEFAALVRLATGLCQTAG